MLHHNDSDTTTRPERGCRTAHNRPNAAPATAVAAMQERLDSAYQTCAEITRAHSRSFYLSSAFLPSEKRRAVRALYAFCRLSDNLVDQEGPASPHERRRRLQVWREAMRRPPEAQDHPVLLAWAACRQRYAIPIRYSEELLDGMQMDLVRTRYQTFEELWRYCYRVASTVGLNTMHIVGFDERPETYQRAQELGVALQLTNILRDVGEDWRRGRIYLPQEDLARFGYSEAELGRGVINDRYRALIDWEIRRAHGLYERAWPGLALLHTDGRLAIALAAQTYRAILQKIVRNGYDNFHRRAALTTWEKLSLLPGLWWRTRRWATQAPALES